MLVSHLLDRGYQRVAKKNLAGPGGTRIDLDSGIVHGTEWDGEGNLVGLYWVGGSALAVGFTIPADVWSYLGQNEDIAWVILPGPDDTIHAMPFDRLRSAVDVFPAEYRVRLTDSAAGEFDSGFPRSEGSISS